MLRAEHEDLLTDIAAPVGFVIQPSESTSGLHVLMDRAGLVLGRGRSATECQSMLSNHLGAFLTPPPHTVRLRMRALVHEDGHAVLVVAPLLSTPPAIERRVEQAGYSMVDRLAVDVDESRCLDMTPARWASTRGTASVPGHTGFPQVGTPVTGILLPQLGSAPASQAALINRIITEMSPGSSEIGKRLRLAEWLASLSTYVGSTNSSSDLYVALRDITKERTAILRLTQG